MGGTDRCACDYCDHAEFASRTSDGGPVQAAVRCTGGENSASDGRLYVFGRSDRRFVRSDLCISRGASCRNRGPANTRPLQRSRIEPGVALHTSRWKGQCPGIAVAQRRHLLFRNAEEPTGARGTTAGANRSSAGAGEWRVRSPNRDSPSIVKHVEAGHERTSREGELNSPASFFAPFDREEGFA